MFKNLSLIFLFCSFLSLAQSADDNNRFMLAQNFEQAGEFTRARQIYAELYQKYPGVYLYFDALNRMYIQLKEYSASELLLKTELAKKPADINLILMLGKTLYISGKEKSADSLWNSFLKSSNHNASVYRAFANTALEIRNFDLAINFLSEARNRSTEKIQYGYEIANLLSLKMQYAEAAKEYLAIIDLDPNNIRSVESRILSNSQKPGAIEEITKYVAANAPKSNPYRKFLLATLYRETGRFKEALGILKELDIPLMNNGGELISFASIAAQEGEFSAAAEAYSYLISALPKSPFVSQAKLGLAKNLSRSVYQSLTDSASLWKPFLPPAFFDENRFREVINSYSEIVKSFPHSEPAIEALFNLAKIYFDCGNPQKGESYIDEIVKNYPMSGYFIPTVLLSVNESLKRGETDLASAKIERISTGAFNYKRHQAEIQFLKAKIAFYRFDFTTASGIIHSIYSELRDNSVNDALEFSMLTNVNLSDSASLAVFATAEMYLFSGRLQEAYNSYLSLSKNENLYLLKYFAQIRMMEIDIALNRFGEAILMADKQAGNKMNIFADKAAYYKCLINLYGVKDSSAGMKDMEDFLEKYPASLYVDKVRSLLINLKNKNI